MRCRVLASSKIALPTLVRHDGRLSVSLRIGSQPVLSAVAYDPGARIKALDKLKIDMPGLSSSPILLFYWEDAAIAAHFSRRKNEEILEVVKQHPDRFIDFGSVPLQSVRESIAIAKEAKNIGFKGLEIGNGEGTNRLATRSSSHSFTPPRILSCCCLSTRSTAGSPPTIGCRRFSARCSNSPFAPP